jgi:hypothetical protein
MELSRLCAVSVLQMNGVKKGKKGGKVVSVHTMKAYSRTVVLDGGERSTSCTGCYTPKKEPLHPLRMRLDGSHSQSGCFGVHENHLPLPGFEPQIVQPIA